MSGEHQPRTLPLAPDGSIIRWLDCRKCRARGYFLKNAFALNPFYEANMLQCGSCKRAYDARSPALAPDGSPGHPLRADATDAEKA